MKKCRHRVQAGARDRGCGFTHRVRGGLAIGAVVLAAPAAFAQASYEPEPSVIEAALALARQSAAALAPPQARIEATPGRLDARLRLAPCAQVEPFLAPGLPAWGATRVGLRCLSGRVLWRAFIPVQVQVLAPAWTSKVALPTGTVVAVDQWQLVETDWAASASPPLGAPVSIAGRTLARPVNPGQALREIDLQARRWFVNGQSVRILASGPGYSIQSEGLALSHGIEGQPVRVRTEGGRILVGQAVGEALVEVRP